MKLLLTAFYFFLCFAAFAQKVPTISINATVINGDSIAVPFNYNYDLVEDGCANIIRYCHYNANSAKFRGPFTDVAKDNPNIILAQGNYDNNGLKEGKFVMHYFNGKLQAEGNYQKNQYDGDWVFYFENGNPSFKGNFTDGNYNGRCSFYSEDGRTLLTFIASGNSCSIIEALDKNGNKMISNGNGYYLGDQIAKINWQGKLLNGKPDSTWTCTQNFATGMVTITENFNNGVFQSGHVSNGNFQQDYSDVSRINLQPYMKRLMINRSDVPGFASRTCDGNIYKECKYIFMGKTYDIHNLTGVEISQ
jgi:hypothetical protein